MKWFGESWGAPACDPDEHIATPVGEKCAWCTEPIEEHDAGVSLPVLGEPIPSVAHYHLNCWLRQVLGSTAHQVGECSCVGGHAEPLEMTPRQEADFAVDLFYLTQSAD